MVQKTQNKEFNSSIKIIQCKENTRVKTHQMPEQGIGRVWERRKKGYWKKRRIAKMQKMITKNLHTKIHF